MSRMEIVSHVLAMLGFYGFIYIQYRRHESASILNALTISILLRSTLDIILFFSFAFGFITVNEIKDMTDYFIQIGLVSSYYIISSIFNIIKRTP